MLRGVLLLTLVLLSSACAATLQKAERYADQDRPDKVIEVCRKLVRKDPRNQEAWALLGLAYADIGNYPASLTALDEALRINPQDASSLLTKGQVLVLSGYPEPAVQYLRTALNLDPAAVIAYYYLGLAYWELGAAAEASQAFEAYLSSPAQAQDDPSVGDAQNRLRVLQAVLVPPVAPPAYDSYSSREIQPAPTPPQEQAPSWSPEPESSEPPVATQPPVANEMPYEGGTCEAVATIAIREASQGGRKFVFKRIAKELTQDEAWQGIIAGGLEIFWQVYGAELMQQQAPVVAGNLCRQGSRLLQYLSSLEVQQPSNMYAGR
jgi:thioredoxin-like negative regulator of GroEL